MIDLPYLSRTTAFRAGNGLGTFACARAFTDFARFEAAIREIPEVVECDALGGGIDYLLTVVTRDIDHYRQLMEALLARDVGIAGCRGYVVTKRIKEPVGLPLEVITT